MSSAQERATGYQADAQGQAQQAEVSDQAASYEDPYQRGPVGNYDEGGTVAAAGFTALAATLMILTGLWSFFVGLTGVIKQSFYINVPNYTFQLNLHAWGWTHMILGAVVFAAGVCLLLGMMWARVVGVVLAVLSAIANFLFLPHYPLWSVIVIAVDVFIIWALTAGTARRKAL
jgi:hypothetical protein